MCGRVGGFGGAAARRASRVAGRGGGAITAARAPHQHERERDEARPAGEVENLHGGVLVVRLSRAAGPKEERESRVEDAPGRRA